MQQSASCRERAGSAHLRNGPLKSGHDFSVQYWLSAEPSPEGNLTLWAFPAAHCSSLPPCITALSPPSVVLVDKTGFSFQRALLPTNSWALGAQVHFTTWHLTWKDTFPHIKAYRISISTKTNRYSLTLQQPMAFLVNNPLDQILSTEYIFHKAPKYTCPKLTTMAPL